MPFLLFNSSFIMVLSTLYKKNKKVERGQGKRERRATGRERGREKERKEREREVSSNLRSKIFLQIPIHFLP